MEAIYSNWFIKRVAKGTAAFFSALILSALLFSSLGYIEYSQAESVDTLVQVNVAPVLDLRIEKSGVEITELDLSVTPTAAGVFAKDDLDVIVNTSNVTGYVLTMANNDTDTAMHNTVATVTDTISSLTTYASEQTFGANTWGYSTEDISLATQVFSPIPASTAPATLKTVNNAATEDTTAVTFATKVDTNIQAGTYQDTVVFSATTNYVPPATSSFTVSPVVTTNLAGGDTFTLDTDINWMDNLGSVLVTVYPANNLTDTATCTNPTAVKYEVSGVEKLRITCTSPARAVGTYNVDLELLSLNRKFTATNAVEYKDPTITGITTMQEMTSEICAATTTPDVADTNVPQSTLTDTRDGKTYMVRKLSDGNCWMVKNLDLDLSTAVTLDSTTSDLSAGRTWTPQNDTQTTAGLAWVQDGGDVARSFEPGGALYFPNGVGTGTADSYNNLAGSTTGQPWEHVGNYYNWYAATAGTGTAAMTEGQTATDSICPKGWKLPDNAGSKSFLNLVATTYGIADDATDATKLLQAPLNFVRGGLYHWSSGQVCDKGAYGYWWSTAAQSATNAYSLDTSSTRVIPQHAHTKGYGFTVRCVAR